MKKLAQIDLDEWMRFGGGFLDYGRDTKIWYNRTRFVCPFCFRARGLIWYTDLSGRTRIACNKECFSVSSTTEYLHLISFLCHSSVDNVGLVSASFFKFKEIPNHITDGGYDGYDIDVIPFSTSKAFALREELIKQVGIYPALSEIDIKCRAEYNLQEIDNL